MAAGANVVTGPKAKDKVKMANPTDECLSLVLVAVTLCSFGWTVACTFWCSFHP